MTDGPPDEEAVGSESPASDVERRDATEVSPDVASELVRFTRALREVGAEVPVITSITAAEALVELELTPERTRAALQAVLLTRQEDAQRFERLFETFWRRLTSDSDEPYIDTADDAETTQLEVRPLRGSDASTAETSEAGPDDTERAAEPAVTRALGDALDPASDATSVSAATYSRTGARSPLAAEFGRDAESERLKSAVQQLTRVIATVTGRRWRRDGTARPDLRRALRKSLTTGGMVADLPRRERRTDRVRATFLVDVSQSVLDTIDRGFLLRFLSETTARWRDTRVFFFDDNVRDVTAQFAVSDPGAVLAALERAETEWGGGTRIGHAIETLREMYPPVVDRETVVFVISDGLEVGELDRLERGITWLSRCAAATLWLNPLASAPEYEPTCRGMTVSYPYVDGLFSFSSVDDVEEMTRQLRVRGLGGNVGFEYDRRRHRRSERSER
ncbi:hypothetical protein SAMN04487948_113104 [Halogranum amylolyticum]|uniref:VWA domain containing CoxE-like protein n=1 Tax=Halogranum amylolyticum TaxID=660520 RepID=A0A1H8V029_9EURY|nr:VWA domain-containing protein [Halogranum amylolyticum]SEP08832.1 hypothetical protein SAMN04487948_113104 [Halogranum amylolyticum]